MIRLGVDVEWFVVRLAIGRILVGVQIEHDIKVVCAREVDVDLQI